MENEMISKMICSRDEETQILGLVYFCLSAGIPVPENLPLVEEIVQHPNFTDEGEIGRCIKWIYMHQCFIKIGSQIDRSSSGGSATFIVGNESTINQFNNLMTHGK